jgi:signal transduction histidine kinase
LRRALANLVDNAARHTPAGGHIDLTVRERAGQGTEIEVLDSGTGIPAEHLPRVFERFYRSEKSPGQAHATSGFGLGLAIVKSIMDLHAGTVEIASTPGSGTTITLFFPTKDGSKMTEM